MCTFLVIDRKEYDDAERLNKLFELEHEEGAVDFEKLQEDLEVVDAAMDRIFGVKQ